MNEKVHLWLRKKRYEELNTNFRTIWDLYIKFYTVCLTFNVAGLGLTTQWIEQKNRWPVVIVFTLLNIITSITSAMMAKHSEKISLDIESTAKFICLQEEGAPLSFDKEDKVLKSPVPHSLAKYAGYANFFACLLLASCWIALLFK